MRLHINIDHVATLRNARGTTYPDPVLAAAQCLAAGANGITVHLREDRRHIVDRDVERLRTLTTTLNLEMAATDAMVAIARRIKPDVVTLVPERREERTTEGGLDAVAGGKSLEQHVRSLREGGIKVSLFIAASPEQVDASLAAGAQQIELHTGEYANARPENVAREVASLAEGARRAHGLGLEVAAGHGLTQGNVGEIATIAEVAELNIGHAVVCDALFLSMAGAVRAMRAAVDRGVARRPKRAESLSPLAR